MAATEPFINDPIILENGDLRVTLRHPDREPRGVRFDTAAAAVQVVLHGRHTFCQPEQRLPGRITCWGEGLCGELDIPGIAEEVPAGDFFPKPGVGLLRQAEDRAPYHIMRAYEARRFPKRWEAGADWAVFTEEPEPCLGIALRLRREIRLEGNAVVLTTEAENTGTRAVSFTEYQHNFVALDDLPVGDGYSLEIPFDGTLAQLPGRFRRLEDGQPVSRARTEGQRVLWTAPPDSVTWHKVTEAPDILPCPEYRWTLSHRDSAASVSEVTDFRPARLVLWGVEHCICTEVYFAASLAPGGRCTWRRTWVFRDETAGG